MYVRHGDRVSGYGIRDTGYGIRDTVGMWDTVGMSDTEMREILQANSQLGIFIRMRMVRIRITIRTRVGVEGLDT